MSHKRLLPLLILMVVFSPLAIDVFLPALPLMAEDLHVNLAQMQWSVTSFILAVGFGQLIYGPLADRFGRKPVALSGVLIYLISAILTASAHTIELHLIARLMQGFGACALIVAAFTIVRDRFDAIKSGMCYSYLNGAICCIPALAPIIGDILTVRFGWRSTFEFIAIYGAIAGVFLALLLKETKPEHTIAPQKLLSLKAYLPIIKHPLFLYNSLVVTLSMSVIIAYVSSSPAWLIVKLGQSQSDFVFWFSINAVVNIIACLVAPKVLEKAGPRLTSGLGMMCIVVGGVTVMVLINWPHPLGFMLPVMLSSIGFSLVMGTCSAQALAPFGEKAGTATALLGFMQMSGAAVIVFLIQKLPLNSAEQLGLTMLAIVPLYVLWAIPAARKHLTFDAC